MTFDDFVLSIATGYNSDSGLRYGQWVFNSLSDVRPDICDLVVHESLNGPERVDPFNNDENLKAFWAFVEKHW